MIGLRKACLHPLTGIARSVLEPRAGDLTRNSLALALQAAGALFPRLNASALRSRCRTLMGLMVVALITPIEKLSEHVAPEHSRPIKLSRMLLAKSAQLNELAMKTGGFRLKGIAPERNRRPLPAA